MVHGAQVPDEELVPGMVESIKVSLHTLIPLILIPSAIMGTAQLQLGETHLVTELAAAMDWAQLQVGETRQATDQAAAMDSVQHRLGETRLIQSVLVQVGIANFLTLKNTLSLERVFLFVHPILALFTNY